uniref:RWP-RK domain-containing protein n=1 Tax=Hordeum vulgare subsp. vulgare TaxID=112509 RepID=A0A8I6XRM0_HORVV
MVMEVEADMERVLGGFSLRLSDRDDSDETGGGGGRGGGSHDEADGGGGAVKERIARALRLYKEASGGDGGALVQVWAPARDGERRRVLATRGQPFMLPSRCRRLLQYRTVSLTHVFAVGGGERERAAWEERGLPGRVFDARAPEWTPNVQFYGTGEYARMSYALIYDIQASLALPILDPADPRRCLAVLELVFTAAPAARFAAEAHNLCKALQAVSLRGSEICHPVPPTEICNSEATQAAMSEVSELLAAVREAHELPLAQAWVRCKQCNRTDVDDDGQHFSLTTAGAPFRLGSHYGGFREACTEHHLRRDQGLVGEAAIARAPRFCADVARRSKDAYPLAHYARMHGLAGCLAVPLRLPQSAMDDGRVEEEWVVLEFFLPPDCRSIAEQKAMVDAIAATVREECSGARLAMSGLQDLCLESILSDSDHAMVAGAANELNGRGDYDTNGSDEEDGDQAAGIHGTDQNGAEDCVPPQKTKKKTGRKAGRPISLNELQGYFSGSLKDAARSLGVCPTTMKRICRQHGISRWPFRKISKVNRALGKIRRAAIESVDCSRKQTTADASSSSSSSSSRRAPAPHLPCLSSALGEDTSSQDSSQDPPPLTKATLPKSLLRRSNGAVGELVTIKASYKGDIIRFRVPCSAGVAAVKEEVAKRLGLDARAFDVKYLDDDHEWVLLSCDADFQECLDVAPVLPASASTAVAGGAAASVSPVVRLMVQEVADNLRSSCGSSD